MCRWPRSGSEAKDGAALRLITNKQQKTRTLEAANVVDTTGIFLRITPTPEADGKEATTVAAEEAEAEVMATPVAWTDGPAGAPVKECNEEEEEPMVGEEEAEEGKETVDMAGGSASEEVRSPTDNRPLVCLSRISILRARSS